MRFLFGLALASMTLASCGGSSASQSSSSTSSPTKSSSTSSYSSSSSSILSSSSSNPITHTKKYGVYDDSFDLKKEDDNPFSLIIYASKNSVTSKKLSVYAKDGTKVFRYGHNSVFSCFLGSEFVKFVEGQDAADSFVRENPKGRVINNEGNAYAAVGASSVPSFKYQPYGVEKESGGYFYMFSKKAAFFSDGVGMGYVSSIIDFSSFHCTYPSYHNEAGWNGYIFYNFLVDSPWNCCDMGLIQMSSDTPGEWLPVFNFNGTMSNPGNEREETMSLQSDGTYLGQGQVLFEGWVTTEAYHMRFTNLETSVVHEYSKENPALSTLASKTYLLVASSLCPAMVGTSLWDARCGLRYENLMIKDLVAAKYDPSNDYSTKTKKDFIPNGEYTNYALTVAPDICSASFEGNDLKVSIVYDE